jgi:hypothetical protein
MPSRWLPSDRVALVERLQTRVDSVSESFFDEHDLGAAYRAVGDNNSNRAKINSALQAAEVRGDVDDVLDTAAALLEGMPCGTAAPVGTCLTVDASSSSGVVAGEGNLQVNYFCKGAGLSEEPRSRGEWLDVLHAAVDGVLGLEVLNSSQCVDGPSQWIRETFAARSEEILQACRNLARVVIDAVRSGDPDVAAMWVDLIPSLAPNPNRGGATALLHLYCAPGVVVYHAGGMAACAMREDRLAGRLLGDGVEVEDPCIGPLPAVVALQADFVYAGVSCSFAGGVRGHAEV